MDSVLLVIAVVLTLAAFVGGYLLGRRSAGRLDQAAADRFAAISDAALDRQGAEVERAAQGREYRTGQMLAPVAQGLQALEARLQAIEKERAAMAADLRRQVDSVRVSGEQVRREARILSDALRTPQVRGSWAEQSLRRLVEASGMVDRVDFDLQVTYRPDSAQEGAGGSRPDMRVNLPGGKCVFVDSKAPLSRLLRAHATEDEDERAVHLEGFVANLRTHVDQLASKRYWDLEAGSPEFVVLYLPSDEVHREAMDRAPDLHEEASRKGVVLAGPSVLLPLLHVVASAWRHVSITEEATKIAALGRDLHTRIATVGSHVAKLGRSLDAAVLAYNKAVGSLESRVLVSARRFEDLGVAKDALAAPPVLSSTTRPMSAPELLED
ncbi:DNA recombination protein RmuC [Schaalia sp. 19OD2882]|uniref:DNA recombination protein RmuC n=1 Tax=Schaalia sp. 19OD2882 TaxID=2794089 RepID=UPI001C1EA547|nr:DNA recombination protein RmuC [Schaalia sp. 19OD2882]QWW19030.1 DNA recombination protein RmuC [Schaalia sp. 19OD2882]